MKQICYLGEIGREIYQTTGIDWTGATGKQVKIRRPGGTTLTKSTVYVDDAPTGQIHIVTSSGDLSETGEYLMQAKATFGTTVLYGPITSFFVEDVL